jgi:hypothetical protein
MLKVIQVLPVKEFLGILSITNKNWSFFNIILIKMKNNNNNILVYLEIYYKRLGTLKKIVKNRQVLL